MQQITKNYYNHIKNLENRNVTKLKAYKHIIFNGSFSYEVYYLIE